MRGLCRDPAPMAQICKCPKSDLISDFTCKKCKHNMSKKRTLCYELFVDRKHRLHHGYWRFKKIRRQTLVSTLSQHGDVIQRLM